MQPDLEGGYFLNQEDPNKKQGNAIFVNVRLGFIRKVYGILAFQLLITTLICIISMTSESFAEFQAENSGIFISVAILSIMLLLAILCFRTIAKKVPINYIALTSFTLCESYMVSFACSSVDEPKIVIMASAMTLGMTLSLTIYAFTTKSDFTTMGSSLFVITSGLLMFGMFMWIFSSWNQPLFILYTTLGVIVYGFYLIYDTQLIMGGKEEEIDMDDYIIGAIMIYLDIIIIFLKLLKLLKEVFGK